MLLRRIYEIKRTEVKYVLRKLPIEERHKSFDSETVIRMVIFFIISGVGLSPLYYGHFWTVVPAPDDRWG
jgi:hypothetical protein